MVALSIVDNILHAALLFGLMRLNIATVSLTRSGLPKAVAPHAFLVDRSDLAAQPPGKIMRVSFDWVSGDGNAPDYDRIIPTCINHDITAQ